MFLSEITWYPPLLYAGAIVLLVLYDFLRGVTAPSALVSSEGILFVGHSVSFRFNVSTLNGFMLYDIINGTDNDTADVVR